MDESLFKNDNMKNAITNKINAAIGKVALGQYQDAISMLENDVLNKTNGCAETGAPDKNDWIKTCAEQNQIYPLVVGIINQLKSLI